MRDITEPGDNSVLTRLHIKLVMVPSVSLRSAFDKPYAVDFSAASGWLWCWWYKALATIDQSSPRHRFVVAQLGEAFWIPNLTFIDSAIEWTYATLPEKKFEETSKTTAGCYLGGVSHCHLLIFSITLTSTVDSHRGFQHRSSGYHHWCFTHCMISH